MNYDHETYANGAGKHSYDVYAAKSEENLLMTRTERKRFNVWANNRDQAARRVERDGWIIESVNMTG